MEYVVDDVYVLLGEQQTWGLRFLLPEGQGRFEVPLLHVDQDLNRTEVAVEGVKFIDGTLDLFDRELVLSKELLGEEKAAEKAGIFALVLAFVVKVLNDPYLCCVILFLLDAPKLGCECLELQSHQFT